MNYHYSNENSQPVGPCTAEQMRELFQQGALHEDSWVIEEGASDWNPYASLFPPVTNAEQNAVRPKSCPSCGTENEGPARFCAGCGMKLGISLDPEKTGYYNAGANRPKKKGAQKAWLVFGFFGLLACATLLLTPNLLHKIGKTSHRKRPPANAQQLAAEPGVWESAMRTGTPAAFAEYFKIYPDSSRVKTKTGTLRGRFWCKMGEEEKQYGVIVTVKGTDLLVNVSLDEAKRLGVINSKPATLGKDTQAKGRTFNYVYIEMMEGTYIIARKINGVVVKEAIEPKDIIDCTIILSKDGASLLSWDAEGSKSSPQPDTKPTFVATAASKPPFNHVPVDISKQYTPESQGVTIESKAGL